MKVPKSVRDKLDPSMVSRIDAKSGLSQATSDYIKNLELSSKDMKERTRKILWEVFQNEGYPRFMSLVSNMKSFKDFEFNDVIQVKGETAEVVLEIILHQFIREHHLDWRVFKGLIIPPEPGKSGSTELDLLLVTPVVVSVIEIKSYNGDKVLTGDCFLEAQNGNYNSKKDIFSQNCLHIRAFWNNFRHFAKTDSGVIKSVLFSFAKGTLTDNRPAEKREVMPVYDEVTVSSYLEALRCLKAKPRWEVDDLVRAIEKAEENAISLDEHIAYLNSKYGDDKN